MQYRIYLLTAAAALMSAPVYALPHGGGLGVGANANVGANSINMNAATHAAVDPGAGEQASPATPGNATAQGEVDEHRSAHADTGAQADTDANASVQQDKDKKKGHRHNTKDHGRKDSDKDDNTH